MNAIERHTPTHILRFHKCRVTSLIIGSDYSDTNIPILISGDEKGVIAKWNLITRRPIETFELPAAVQIVDIHVLDEKTFILSKDHSLRLYTGHNITFEMKVNTLNFSNFEIFHSDNSDLYTLVCCNTSVSENFDIYTFEDGKMNSLQRIFNSVSMMSFIEQHSLLGNDFKKLGILMKIVRDKKTKTIVCGFESGVVIGLKLHVSTFRSFEKSGYIDVQFISKFHYPNPILDISVDTEKGIVITSSTESQIETITLSQGDISSEDIDSDTYFTDDLQRLVMSKDIWCKGCNSSLLEVQYGNIGHVDITPNSIIYSTWSGKTVVLDRATSSQKHVFWSSKSHVAVSESSQGNIDPNRNKIADRKGPLEKIGSLVTFDGTHSLSTDVVAQQGSMLTKSGHSRRLGQFLQQPWCIVGYESGAIAMYSV